MQSVSSPGVAVGAPAAARPPQHAPAAPAETHPERRQDSFVLPHNHTSVVPSFRIVPEKADNMERIGQLLNHLGMNPTNAIGSTEHGASTARAVGGSAGGDNDDPYAIEGEFPDLDHLNIPLVGTDADLAEDYVAGLNMMSMRLDDRKMGYVDTVESGHILLLTHPKSVAKVLTTSVQHFLGGLRPPSAAFFGSKVLFILEGKEWLDLRNVLKKSFQKHNLALMTEDTQYAARKYASILEKYASIPNDSGEQDVDMMHLIAGFHLTAISKVSFDKDIGALDDFADDGDFVINQSFEYLLEELPRRAYAPDWETQNDYESDTPDNRMLAEMSFQARDVVRQCIAERLELINSGEKPRGDLLQKMIDVYSDDYPEVRGNVDKLTDELGDNLVEIMFAGYNTVVPTTSHLMYFLSKRPDIQERIMEEVDEVLMGRICSMDDMKKLKLIEACIMEALRLTPPASLVSRQTTRDLTLNGVEVPRATRVWMPACYIHRDPDTWDQVGPNGEQWGANSFEPDRWFHFKPKNGSYIPFSHGPRSCAGRNFAMFEMAVAVATLLQNYWIKEEPSYSWKTIFTGFGLRPFDFNTATVSARVCVRKRGEA